jgi:flagellum-specific ATP synthase
MLIDEAIRKARSAAGRGLSTTTFVRPRGSVRAVSGWLVRTSPMLTRAEEAVLVRGVSGAWHRGVAIAAEADETHLLMLEGAADMRPGLPAEALGEPLTFPVGDALIDRIVDPLGRALDEGPSIICEGRRPIFSTPPAPSERRAGLKPLWTGVRALDAFVTCARGQRLGIIGPAGSGKTTLLRMVCRHARADIVVLALIGERGREVFEAFEEVAVPGRPAVIVAAAPHDPPALRRLVAFSATAIAEHFRDLGADVLLAVDSLTRLAHAQREVGLALGELPATRAYPPSVFGLLPQLIERAGPAGAGAITGFYSVLVESEDLSDPIAEVAMASLDGQAILSRRLANRAVYPALDLQQSLSRLMCRVVSPEHERAAVEVRRLAQTYEEARDLLDCGLYRPGANPTLDRAVQLRPLLERFMTQSPSEGCNEARTLAELSRMVRSLV